MGKTTLYHPVSLHVIRGSLENSGFKASRIKQLGSSKETKWAKYTLNLTKTPRGFSKVSPYDAIKILDGCFSKDITVTSYSEFRENKKYIMRAKVTRTVVIDVYLDSGPDKEHGTSRGGDPLWQSDDDPIDHYSYDEQLIAEGHGDPEYTGYDPS